MDDKELVEKCLLADNIIESEIVSAGLAEPDDNGDIEQSEIDIYKPMLRQQIHEAIPIIRKAIIEGISPLYDALIEFIAHGDYSNGNTSQGVDEGEYMAFRRLSELKKQWQAFRERYGGG